MDRTALVLGAVFAFLLIVLNVTFFSGLDVNLATVTIQGTRLHHGYAVALLPIGLVMSLRSRYKRIGSFLIGLSVILFVDDFSDVFNAI